MNSPVFDDREPPEPAHQERLPRLLAFQPDVARQADWRTVIEAGGHLAFVPVASVDATIEALLDLSSPIAGLLLPWPKGADPTPFFSRLRRARLPVFPNVLALASQWKIDEGQRAARLGVQVFLQEPLSLDELVKELVAVRRGGTSPSADRLFGALDGSDPDWRARMSFLANQIRKEGVVNWEKRVGELVASLKAAVNREIEIHIAEALLFFARRDHRQLETSLSENEDLDLELLKHLYDVASEQANKGTRLAGNDARVIRLLEGTLAFVRKGTKERDHSQTFSRLRFVATSFLAAKSPNETVETVERRSFRLAMAAVLEISPEFLSRMGPRLKRMAAQLVRTADEQKALDLARLTVLAFVLRGVKDGTAMPTEKVDYERLKVISELLGSSTHSELEVAERLKVLGEQLSAHPTGLDEIPDFDALRDLVREEGSRADPEVLVEMGLDSRALHRGLAAIDSTWAPEVEEPVVPEVVEEPKARQASSLLERLASEMGIPAQILAAYDSPDLLDRLPEVESDYGLAAGALARVRVTALLVSKAKSADVTAILNAFAKTHFDKPQLLDALQRILVSTGLGEAARFLMSARLLAASRTA